MSFYKEVPGRQTTLESTLKFDTAPTAGSTNPVTSDGVNTAITDAVGDASEALQQQIDDIAEKAGSGYIPKGPASVATLNGLSGQENGELYTMTDAGTLTLGTLSVVAGDTVAWDEANSVWYKAMDYAPRQYGTNEVHNLSTTATEADLVSGNYFALDGSAETKKLPAEYVAKRSESIVKSAGKNLWNNGDVLVGYIRNNGAFDSGLTSYRASGFIPIEPSTNYYASKRGDTSISTSTNTYFAFYGSDKTFISAVTATTKSFTTPATAYFARFTSYYDGDSPTIQIEKGNTRTSFAEYTPIGGYYAEKYVEGSIPDNAMVNPKVSEKAGKNLFNANDIAVGYIRNNGVFDSALTGYRASGYIPVKASTDYHASKPNDAAISTSAGTYIAFYDANKNFISAVAATTKSFTTPASTAYTRVTASYDTNVNYIQIEEGSARTMFVPYTPIGGHNAESYTEGSIPDSALKNLKATEKAGKNLFNVKSISVGYIKNNGDYDSALTGYRASGFIQVEASTAYYASKPNDSAISTSAGTYIAFYNSDKVFISAVSATTKSFTTPANTAYTRITIAYDSNLSLVQLEKGSERTSFFEFNPVGGYESENYAEGSLPDTAFVNPKVTKKPGKNLFDFKTVSIGYMKYDGSIESSNTGYRVSDYVEVEPSTAYHMSTAGDGVVCFNTNTYIAFYNENRSILSLIQSNVKDITTPANTKYIRFSIYYDASTFQTIQFEFGSARTEFEAYSPIAGYSQESDEKYDRKYYQRVVPRILPVTEMAAVCFVFDDGVAKDDDVVALFDSYGVRCGFALPWGTSSVTNRLTKYQHYQRIGFSCLNHTGDRLDSYADEAEANAVVAGGKFNLEKNGFCINGWVCPENVYVTAYRSMLGKYHGYAFGDHGDGDKNTTATDILRLRRYSIENSAVTLNDVKNLIDGAISNGYMYCFYAHASNIGETGYNDIQFWTDVLQYVIAKRDAGELFFDCPDNVVKYYFDL